MTCRQCGGPVRCTGCGAAAEPPAMEAAELLDELVRAFSEGKAAGEVGDERQFLIVARGHESLLEQIRGVVGEMGWFRVIENRRRDGTLLPRAGAEGTFFSP